MNSIEFTASVIKINDWSIVHIPRPVSEGLPSRGMVMAEVSLDSLTFTAPLEPDGNGSHWFRVDEVLNQDFDDLNPADFSVSLTPIKDWTEPVVPADLENALTLSGLLPVWDEITTKAKWEWIRWIRFTHNPKTRQKRIETTCSKLESGMKRPCCFDHSRCTEPHVSKSGILLEPNSAENGAN